MASITINHTR